MQQVERKHVVGGSPICPSTEVWAHEYARPKGILAQFSGRGRADLCSLAVWAQGGVLTSRTHPAGTV